MHSYALCSFDHFGLHLEEVKFNKEFISLSSHLSEVDRLFHEDWSKLIINS